jgi:threonine/homoserine/homoserine lactone efflux protein
MPEQALGTALRWGPASALIATSLAIMGSPGPATISLVAAGSAYGLRRSLRYMAGIVTGTTVVLLAVATGLTAALLAVPAVRPALLAAAALYLLWLAYHIATAPPLESRGAAATAPSWSGGLFLGMANPKAWVAIAAVFASARLAGSALWDAAAKLALLEPMIVLINVVWLTVGASLAPWLRDPRRARLVNGGLAAALLAATAAAVVR